MVGQTKIPTKFLVPMNQDPLNPVQNCAMAEDTRKMWR